MGKKIPVQDLYDSCEMMLRDVWGYILDTAGVMWSKSKQASYQREHDGQSNYVLSCQYGGKWAGHMVTDCSGVLVYIWKQHGLTIDHGSNSIARKSCLLMQKTAMPGYAAFKWKKEDTSKYPDGRGDYYHIGIVSEDGLNVYESKGAQTGFVMSAASSWHFFAQLKDVDYEGGNAVIWTAIVNTESGRLNVRSGPGTDYKKIGSLPKGEEVDVFKEENGWAYIAGDGLQGYVSMAYLMPVNATETPVDAPDKTDNKTPAESETNQPAQSYVAEWAVYVPCESGEEAKRYAANIKNALVLRIDKPPDAKGDD